MHRSTITRLHLRWLAIGLVCAGLVSCRDVPAPLGPDPVRAGDGAVANTLPDLDTPPRAPVTIWFEKDLTSGPEDPPEGTFVWEGRAWVGDVEGTLVSTIDLMAPTTRFVGQTLHAVIEWTVTGDLEFSTATSGIANLANGIVRSNGRIDSGYGAGAAVHQQGQLDENLSAEGFLRLAPATR